MKLNAVSCLRLSTIIKRIVVADGWLGLPPNGSKSTDALKNVKARARAFTSWCCLQFVTWRSTVCCLDTSIENIFVICVNRKICIFLPYTHR